ncbi:MAG TPA: hypothetical protein DCM38_07615 [Gammaproteobacteria bacterium]|nr:hypothetical protein [Gammaproteobacteria bacterium]
MFKQLRKTMQLQAGYILPLVKKLLLENGKHIQNIDHKINHLLKQLCYFELETNTDLSSKKQHLEPLVAVANNLITRGLPTQASIEIETVFSKTFRFTQKQIDELGNIHYNWNHNPLNFEPLYAALHLIEPRLNRHNHLLNALTDLEKLDSESEERFLYQIIPSQIGDYFIQLLEPQRLFTSILNDQTDFTQQRVDFCIEFPYPITGKKGLIIEIDGPQHDQAQQMILDRKRDSAVEKADWAKTLRIKTDALDQTNIQFNRFEKIASQLNRLKQMLKNDYFQRLIHNYNNPLYQTKQGLEALQFILTPFAIARMHKSLIELILKGDLNLTAPLWQIVVIERDVPCAFLAIEEFKTLFANLFLLEGQNRTLPPIKLQVFVTEEFKTAQLNQPYPIKTINALEQPITCDLLIDIAMLQRAGFTDRDTRIHCQHFVTIRSAHAPTTKRVFYSSDLIQYRQIAKQFENETHEILPEAEQSLTYFLQNIFRKEQFRPGQLEILNRALQRQSVIGLLPTGAGKSLTYQLAVCLQPGIALIIDPIKSLMQDQYENLLKNHIDACLVINSSLNTKERLLATDKLIEAQVLFTFISPERLQIQEFREALLSMSRQSNYFSYCVIDEVHCVSEWGHDFRTAYLKLGHNAIKFCKTKNLPTIPLFGLTATASFDVLSDIQRELSANNEHRLGEEAIIRFETTNREELQFEILKIETENAPSKPKIGLAKQAQLDQVLKTIAETLEQYNKMPQNQNIALKNFEANHFFNENGTHAGLIFCPHRSWYFGVTNQYKKQYKKVGVYDHLIDFAHIDLPHLRAGTFIGSDNQNKNVEIDSARHQADFIQNKLNLLVATKAFGMGIDKPNIRFTVHINYPSSIESFVQEAGRAGRDRKLAICYILFNDQTIIDKRGTIEVDKDILEHFYRRSFKGEEHEKSLLYHHFLNRIIYPAHHRLKIIAEKLSEAFDIEIHLNIWQHTRLYLNQGFDKHYGYLNLSNLKINTNRSDDKALSYRLLKFVKSYLEEKCPPTENVVLWLETPAESEPGIEKQLAEIEIGEKLAPIIIPFQVGDDKMDKEKAIYRLSTIGVIDDYTLDFNSKHFVLYATKKTDDAYKAYLCDYIKTFYSDVRANQEIKKVDSYKGKTTIQKCLGFLIDFVYEEVAKKRLEAINTMRMACYEGLKENGNQLFKEFIDLYFHAKYARKHHSVADHNYSLTDLTDEGKNQNIQWVWDFIGIIEQDKTGSQLNNLKHLRGACLRLLIDHPDNACLLLLKAFTVFILEADNDKLIKEAKESLIKGFLIFQATQKMSVSEYLSEVFKYQKELEKYHLAQILENEISLLCLKAHTAWLAQFNNNFLEDYESSHSQRTD